MEISFDLMQSIQPTNDLSPFRLQIGQFDSALEVLLQQQGQGGKENSFISIGLRAELNFKNELDKAIQDSTDQVAAQEAEKAKDDRGSSEFRSSFQLDSGVGDTRSSIETEQHADGL